MTTAAESATYYRNFYEECVRTGGLLDTFHSLGVKHGLDMAQIDCLKGGDWSAVYSRIGARLAELEGDKS